MACVGRTGNEEGNHQASLSLFSVRPPLNALRRQTEPEMSCVGHFEMFDVHTYIHFALDAVDLYMSLYLYA